MVRLVLSALALCAALPAAADNFRPVQERGAFLKLVEGKKLHLPLFGVALKVAGDGAITGTASGYDVTGRWNWEDGFFCREMDWGGTDVPYNCQLVETNGAGRIRFTSNQGKGESAEFGLR